MKEQLLGIVKYVLAPVVYLAVVIYILKLIWNRSKLREDEEDSIDQDIL